MDISSKRNVQGMDITYERNVKWANITRKWKEQGMDITCERYVQGRGRKLHVREMYRKWMFQVKGSYRGQMQDGDHAERHYITLVC